jgi:glycosyltransferase involved in cell wall biosynthesis
MSPLVSVVVPVYRNAESLPELCHRLSAALEPEYPRFEVILIDDGSPDGSWSIIQQLVQAEPRLKGVRLSRNFGQHPAIAAGFDRASGEVIVLMDADLEDRPESLPQLIGRLTSGIDIVYTIKMGENGGSRFSSSVFHSVFSRIVGGGRIPRNIGTLRVFSRKVLEAIKHYREHDVLFGPLMFFIGFSSIFVEVERDVRYHGRSSYTFAKRLRLAVRSLISYTEFPHRVLLWCGLLIVTAIAAYGAVVSLQVVVLGAQMPPGLTLITLLIVTLMGITMISLGIIGSYIYRVYQEVLRRPRYLVTEEINLTGNRR